MSQQRSEGARQFIKRLRAIGRQPTTQGWPERNVAAAKRGGFYKRKQMPTANFTHDDLIAAIRESLTNTNGEAGLTMNEILEALGMPRTLNTTQRRKLTVAIGQQIKDGRMECVMVQRPTIIGRLTTIPAYRIKEAN